MVVHWPQKHLGLLLGIEKIWPIADWRVPSGDPRKHCGTHLGSNPFLFVKWRIRGSKPSTTPRLLPLHLPQCPCRCFMRLKPVRSWAYWATIFIYQMDQKPDPNTRSTSIPSCLSHKRDTFSPWDELFGIQAEHIRKRPNIFEDLQFAFLQRRSELFVSSGVTKRNVKDTSYGVYATSSEFTLWQNVCPSVYNSQGIEGFPASPLIMTDQ